MASGALEHLEDIPRYELGHGQAVLVQHVMGQGRGKGSGKSSSSTLWRDEEEATEHEKERHAMQYDIATPGPGDDASGERLGADPHFVRQALVEQEHDKKEAEVVTRSMARRLGGAFVSLFADGRRESLSPASRWTMEEDDKKTRERQLKTRSTGCKGTGRVRRTTGE